MSTHVKVLAWLYIVFGVLGSLFGLAMMALLSVIGAAGAASDPDAWMALPILGFTGAALGVFMLFLSLPGIIAGVGLLKFRPWARILTIVMSALNLMNVPFGTILGVYASGSCCQTTARGCLRSRRSKRSCLPNVAGQKRSAGPKT